MTRAEGVLEILDREVAPADRAASLADIDRLNAWFAGYRLTLGAIRRLASGAAPGRPMLVVDVGGGTADFAVRLIGWARGAGRPIRAIAVDRDADALRLGGRAGCRYPEIFRVLADARALPFRSGAVDVVTTSLTLHHLEPADAVVSLAEMRRTARLGIVVNDLLRTRVSLALVWLATRVLARHPISRVDGPLSVRRAYAPGELRALARRAGLERLTLRRFPLLARLLMVAE